MTRRLWIPSCAALVLLQSCGYGVGGKAITIPQGIHTIAIPAFGSSTMRYRLADQLPQEIGREFNTRTRFRAVTDPSEADAVLRGTINSAGIAPTVSDPTSGKATVVQVTVVVTVNLYERATNRVLYSRPNAIYRQNYSIATDPHQFFDESGPAFDRLSTDLARDVVSAITEDF
jgi:hypothetical protein